MSISAPPELGTVSGALEALDRAAALVRDVVEDLDPDTVTGEQAAIILERYVKLERGFAAGRLAFTRRAAECMNWRAEGHRSAADWLAQKTKTSVGEAISTLQTAKSLPVLPATTAALRRGELSVAQAREIASVATVAPAAEAELVEAAAHLTLRGLQHQVRVVCATAADNQLEQAAAVRRSRSFRHWLDPEGGFNIQVRTTLDSGAEVLSAVRARAAFVADEAAQAKVAPEPREAYEADALVALVLGDRRAATFQGTIGGRTRSAVVYLHVSQEALRRGEVLPGELCEIPGVGPVPLATVEHLFGESVAKIIIEDGVDVRTVCNLGRTVPAALEAALEARDRECVVPGCDVHLSLEIDHWRVPFAQCGPTALWNLARICKFHHNQKTYDGWQLRGGPGQWEWVPPHRGGP